MPENAEKDDSLLTLVPTPRMLGQRYRLEKRLGQGGMGKVYCATDVSLNRTVAVKMIRDELFANQSAMEKFRQESRVTASLAHPERSDRSRFWSRCEPARIPGHGTVGRDYPARGVASEDAIDSRSEPSNCLKVFAPESERRTSRGLVHRDLKPEDISISRPRTCSKL